MRVAVIGAGIVGVTTAYELAADGHEVVVYERRASVATESSFANGGVVAAGLVAPWSAPGLPLRALMSSVARHPDLRICRGTLLQLPWLWRAMRASSSSMHRTHRQQMQALAAASQQRMLGLAQSLELEFEQSQGYMVLFRSARDLSRYRSGLAALVSGGTTHEVVDAARARLLEPALTDATPLHAALLLPTDGVGNCRQFAHQLKAHAQRLGADFRLGVEVTDVSLGQRIGVTARDGPEADSRTQDFDAVVIAAGTAAARIGAPLGIRLPIVAVHGYSLTAPICHREAEPDPGPRCGVMDARHGIAISRLGQRIRVAGISEIGGHPNRMNRNALQSLYDVLEDWFPGAAEIAKAQHWKGARPMLPEGAPMVGASVVPGIWLNIGHGSHGWSLACGSARALADQMIGARAAGRRGAAPRPANGVVPAAAAEHNSRMRPSPIRWPPTCSALPTAVAGLRCRSIACDRAAGIGL